MRGLLGNPVLLSVLGVQASLLLLDVWDRHGTRRARYGSERLRPGTASFLIVVSASFLFIQLGGLMLLPPQDELLAGIRALVAHASDRPVTDPRSGLGAFALAVLAFYLAGLWDYLVHRLFSHHRWFWFTHEYHHLPNQVALPMPGLFARPFVFVPAFLTTVATGFSFYASLLLLGSPLLSVDGVVLVVAAIAVVGTASHSSFLRRWKAIHRGMRWLGLTTPHEHRLHHTVEMRGNYGNFVTLWDRVFGTYLDPFDERHRGTPLGLPYDQDYLGTLTLGRLKLPASVRERFQLWRYCNIDRHEGIAGGREWKR